MTRGVAGRAGAAAALLLLAAPAAAAQGWRATVDVRSQRVGYRGWTSDSVPVASVSPGPSGGPVTPDGFAASCAGNGWCYFFRPGERLLSTPLTATMDLAAWGLGVPGLSVHGNFRFHADLWRPNWPAMQPTFQLWEAYAKYATPSLDARLGRQVVTSRLGWTGFDGARGTWRPSGTGLELTAYGGWGMARSTAVPVTSPVVNALGEFRPPQRSLVAGALAGWTGDRGEVRAEYLREVDPSVDKFATERAAVSATVRATTALAVTGGAEYNIAEGVLGTSDVAVRYAGRAATASVGWRRYRPVFDLWSIWAAFSPVAHQGPVASLTVTPREGIALRGRVEAYAFEEAAAETPLAQVEDDGWRWSVGGTVSLLPRWTFDAGWSYDRGVGAAGWGVDGQVAWATTDRLRLRAFGSTLTRPLEFRYDESFTRTIGLDADWRLRDDLTLGLTAMQMMEDRRRPDAAAFDWNQTRLAARITYALGSGTERTPLARALRRMPSAAGQGR